VVILVLNYVINNELHSSNLVVSQCAVYSCPVEIFILFLCLLDFIPVEDGVLLLEILTVFVVKKDLHGVAIK
jgi:hypothetical protein